MGSALVQSFQDSGRLRSVQGDLGRFRVTHTLVVDVRRFEADYTAGSLPVAHVELAVALGDAERHVLAAFTVSASEAAAANRQGAIVEALGGSDESDHQHRQQRRGQRRFRAQAQEAESRSERQRVHPPSFSGGGAAGTGGTCGTGKERFGAGAAGLWYSAGAP